MQINRRSIFSLAAATVALFSTRSSIAADKSKTSVEAVAVDGGVQVPARVIQPPASISEAARGYLKYMAQRPFEEPPEIGDIEGWRNYIAAQNRQFESYGDAISKMPGATVETRTIAGVTVYVATPTTSSPDASKPHLFIHGGSFVLFKGKPAMLLAKVQCLYYGGTVFGVDYRMPPDHPYPAALDDCLAVYRELIKTYAPDKLLVSGDSAGGNLAAALMHKARDAGLPRPGALLLNTPVTDFLNESDSLQTNQYIDVLLKRPSIHNSMKLYLGNADASSPYLSPFRGDLSRGFPPTYLRTGTRDMLLSDTVRMHAALRKAGVDADLYVGEAMPHSGLSGRSPEDLDARADTIRWLDKHWRV